MPQYPEEFHVKVALSPLKIQSMFFKILCMKRHFCPFVPTLSRIFLFLSNTKGLGILFLLLAIKPQIRLASEVLMLHTVCYFTCKCNLFLLKFLFQNRQLIQRQDVPLALLYCFLYSPRDLSPVAYNYSIIFNSQVAFKMRFLSIPWATANL